VDSLIRLKACLFHEMKIVDVNDLLNAEELLRELAMKRIENHLKNVFLTSALSKAVFVPNLSHKVAEYFPLQIANFFTNRETLNHRIAFPVFNDSVNKFGTPNILISHRICCVVQTKRCLLWKYESIFFLE
jgi:hypothetical protein